MVSLENNYNAGLCLLTLYHNAKLRRAHRPATLTSLPRRTRPLLLSVFVVPSLLERRT